MTVGFYQRENDTHDFDSSVELDFRVKADGLREGRTGVSSVHMKAR